MNWLVFVIFSGLIGVKVINAHIVSSWIHKLTQLNRVVLNFLLGYLVQMGFYGVVLTLSYFLNLRLVDLLYLLSYLEIFWVIIAIFNWKFLIVAKTCSWKLVLGLIIMMSISLVTNLVYFQWMFHSYTQSFALNPNTTYLQAAQLNHLITNNQSKLTFEVNHLVWGNLVVNLAFQNYFPHPHLILAYANYFNFMEYGFLFALLIFYWWTKQQHGTKLQYDWGFLVGSLLAWFLGYWLTTYYIHAYWFILYSLIMIACLFNDDQHKKLYYFLLVNLLALSNLFYNYAGFFWIINMTIFAFVYYWKKQHQAITFYLFSSTFSLLYSLIFFAYFKNVANNQFNYGWLLFGLFMFFLLINGLGLIFHNSQIFQRSWLQMTHFFLKNSVKVFLGLNWFLILCYLVYLSFSHYGNLIKLMGLLFNFHHPGLSTLNLILISGFSVIVGTYCYQKFVQKKPFSAFNHPNWISLLLFNNPISYLMYWFLWQKVNGNHEIVREISNNYFAFMLFVIMIFFTYPWLIRPIEKANYHQLRQWKPTHTISLI